MKRKRKAINTGLSAKAENVVFRCRLHLFCFLLLALCFLLCLLLVGPPSLQAVTGNCSNCHTMHNSQHGQPVAINGPLPQLLNADCIPCHTQTVSGNNPPVNSFGAPIVLHTTPPAGQGGGFTTAGGDFYWVATAGGHTDSTGHNVATIAGEDQFIGGNAPGFTPPGWDPTATPGALNDGQVNNGGASWSNQLTCAGLYGCHGNHSDAAQMTAIKGAHHSNIGLTNTQANDPTTIGGSYRFLSGINGLENSNWNFTETAATHNEYFGVSSNANYSNKRTITYSCAECHGIFHSVIGTSPFLRHPSDVVLPGTGEYQNYNPDNGHVYSLEEPVARTSVPTSSSSTVTPGTDIVMCLSCHRAHGSPFFKIMRWDYKSSTLSEALSGCNVCHTSKN